MSLYFAINMKARFKKIELSSQKNIGWPLGAMTDKKFAKSATTDTIGGAKKFIKFPIEFYILESKQQ